MKIISTFIFYVFTFSALQGFSQTLDCNAEFGINYQSVNTVQFNPLQPGLSTTTQHSWNFGDGTVSNAIVPIHTYTSTGTFTSSHILVKLNNNGTVVCRDTFYRVIQIGNTCSLVANFLAQPTNSPNTFFFQNTSTPLNPADSFRWTFGDGTSSGVVNPTHTYTMTGTFNVCLRVIKRTSSGTLSDCIREICHTIVVPGTNLCNLVANFTIQPGTTPNSFHFQNTSVPLSSTDSIRWTFGDGTSTNVVHPNHTYAVAGTYNVCLRIIKRTASGTLSNCVREICNTVVIGTNSCNLTAGFNVHPSSAPNIFIFQNTSTPLGITDSIRWTFGDGTSSNAVNPTHTYSQPGTYNVCLRIIKRTSLGTLSNCVREICHIVIVPGANTCNLIAGFSIHPTSTSNTFNFQNTSTPLNSTDSIKWTFGDGTSSNAVNPSHTFTQPGTYNVCLKIIKRSASGTLTDCIRVTCQTVTTGNTINCSSAVVTFNYHADPVIANKLYFQAVSNLPLFEQSWRITKLPVTGTAPLVINLNNPSYIFPDTGYYRVCLRAVTMGGCIREYCREIHITQLTHPGICNLVIYPNPVTSVVNFNLYLNQPLMIHAYIFNSSSVLVRERHQQGLAGTNIVSILTSNLSAGNYTLKVIYGNNVCNRYFIKL